jgi:Ni/Co efflux regulator RcnB
MRTMVSMLIAVSTLAAAEVLAQTTVSAAQIDRAEAGKASRSAHARAQRADRRRAFEARAERTGVTPAAFDGSWSVAISTQSGACEPHYRFGLQIINGNVVYEGRPAGRVSPNGAVRVNVSSGGQQAAGQGRLSRNYGSGVWRGHGSAGTCAGTWQAGRGG